MHGTYSIKWYTPKKDYKLELKDFTPLEHDLVIVFFPTQGHYIDLLVHAQKIIIGVPFEASNADYHAMPRRVRYYLSGGQMDVKGFFKRGSPEARIVDLATMRDIKDVKMFSILYKSVLGWKLDRAMQMKLWKVIRIKKTLFFLHATTEEVKERNMEIRFRKKLYKPTTGGIFNDARKRGIDGRSVRVM